MKISHQGFSLFELLVTVSLLSILLCLAIPSWKTLREHEGINTVTKQLQQTFSFARNQAILRHESILIIPEKDNWQLGWIVEIEETQEVLHVFPPTPSNIKLTLTVLRNSNSIKIMPDGTLNGSNGHFSYTNTNLYFNRGGRLRLEKTT